MKVSASNFQIFLSKLGKKSFFEGFYYFKFLEYPLVYNNLCLNRKDNYLDIGSGVSIFPLFVVLKNGCRVYICDDGSIIKNSFDYYKKSLEKLNLGHLFEKKLLVRDTQEFF